MSLKNLLRKKGDSKTYVVNYWKGIDLKEVYKELSSSWGILLLIHNSANFKDFADFLTKLPISKKKLLYVSLTKGYDSLKSDIYELKTHIREQNTQFILVDCVSKTVFERKSTAECYFELPPANLRAMTMMINKYLRHFQPKFIILDSLSQFIDFSTGYKDKDTYSFLKYLKDLQARYGCQFVLLYDDYLNKELRHIPRSFFDNIIRLEVLGVSEVPW